MTPSQRGDLILFSQRLFWQIVEKWKEAEKDLEKKGLIDPSRSKWNFVINEKGEIVIFNECVTADVFSVFSPEFFAKFCKDFKNEWTKVDRLPFESKWETYVPPSNGRTNFRHFGWRMNDTIFTERKTKDDEEYAEEPRSTLVNFRRKIMD